MTVMKAQELSALEEVFQSSLR